MSGTEEMKLPSVRFEGVTPILRVQNLQASINYYVDVLGFKIDWHEPGIMASVSRDRCGIMLCEGDQGNPGTWVWIGVENIEPLFDDYSNKGVKVRIPPTNYPWAYEIQIVDPDGHVLRFGSEPKEDQPIGDWLDSYGNIWVMSPECKWVQRIPIQNAKIARMIKPEELKKNEPLKWSTGTGTEVWEMFCAAITGELETIKRLVDRNASLVRCQYAYRKPLYFAVRENQIEVAQFLLERDPDPFGLAVNDSLLDIARDRGYAEMEKLLETFFTNKHNASPKGNIVASAIRERNLEKVQSLLDASPEFLHAGDERSNQPIHWAVMTRQLDIIDELLNRGADINARRSDGARPIHLFNGDYHYRGWRDVPKDTVTTPDDVLAHLVARGAYLDIYTAAHMGDSNRVRELLDENPSLANSVSDCLTYYLGSGTPLKNAAAKGHMEIVKLLLERGADPNQPEEGIAPHGHALYSAVSNGHYDIAKLLLEHGAFPSPEVESSADALSIALMNSDQQMVELLSSYGAARSVDIMAYYGDVQTAAAVFAANPALADDPGALANAAGEGKESFVHLMLRYQPDLPKRASLHGGKTRELTILLFEHGMNPSQPDWLGITPLHQFTRQNDLEKAGIFIAHGADLHARDEDIRSTPLGWAAKFGNYEMVELLLKQGAKQNLPDDPPWATPLAWATRRGHTQIVELLQQFVE